MEKEYLAVILFDGLMVAIFVLASMFYSPWFGDSVYDIIVIENVVFSGFSGEDSNSVVLYVRNTNTVRDLVLGQVRITSVDWERMFSVAPEESGLPVGAYGRAVLVNVDWIEDQEYKFDVFSSNGQLVGSIKVTA